MNILSRYRIAVRRSTGDRAGPPGVALAAVCAGAAAVFARPAAAAGPSANLSMSLNTVTQAVKSVTISPSSLSYVSCIYGSSNGTDLGFPNGACQAQSGPGSVSVQNGSAPATIMV